MSVTLTAPEPKSEPISVRLPLSIETEINDIASDANVSRSAVINYLLDAALTQNAREITSVQM